MAPSSHKPSYTSALTPVCSGEQLRDFVDRDTSPGARTLYVGNLSGQVTRKLLYELMIQAGPVESMKIMCPRAAGSRTFAFVLFEHPASVRYAMLIFHDLKLFRQQLSFNYSGENKNKPQPVYPPFAPTFFELPPGYEASSQETKDLLIESWAIPPLDYTSGYLIPRSEESVRLFSRPENHQKHHSPEPKRFREDSVAASGHLRNPYSGLPYPQPNTQPIHSSSSERKYPPRETSAISSHLRNPYSGSPYPPPKPRTSGRSAETRKEPSTDSNYERNPYSGIPYSKPILGPVVNLTPCTPYVYSGSHAPNSYEGPRSEPRPRFSTSPVAAPVSNHQSRRESTTSFAERHSRTQSAHGVPHQGQGYSDRSQSQRIENLDRRNVGNWGYLQQPQQHHCDQSWYQDANYYGRRNN